jgi:hypothetical protein
MYETLDLADLSASDSGDGECEPDVGLNESPGGEWEGEGIGDERLANISSVFTGRDADCGGGSGKAEDVADSGSSTSSSPSNMIAFSQLAASCADGDTMLGEREPWRTELSSDSGDDIS